ncbi:hypothetical protein [Nannocystis punicea]|uniref:Uncharacterized protein n=1 Tax=Nannocystis punicea TaxID=2995304 RepID=A0ABY7GXZ8_9BACT|nr:hypothetical protein [Nannocystis poenicansa]WAS91760.1 hypothetical protein O0S08_36725 [Nannocystis poenicansa]
MALHRPFRSRGESFVLAAANAVAADAPRIAARARQAEALLAPLFADAFDARALRLLAAELASGASMRDDREVLARLVAAIDAGRLVLVRVLPAGQWGMVESRARTERADSADDDRALDRPVDATHWIEIRLADEDDVAIPGQRYLLIDPDGHQHRGYTDSLGSARIVRLSPGTCRVSFPDLDGGVCELATTPARAPS